DLVTTHRCGEGLGDGVTGGVRHAQDAGGVLDRGLGLDGAEGEDLRDAFLPVQPGDVLDHLPASTLVEVQVDIGHAHAFGVEEPFEQQAVFEGVQVGDAQDVGDHRSGCRPTPRPQGDAVVARVLADVGHHQEVGGKAHFV